MNSLVAVVAVGASISIAAPFAFVECEGPTCVEEYDVISPSPGWLVTPAQEFDGQAKDESCEPCRVCKVKVTWSYTGDEDYEVWLGGSNVCGSGNARGADNLSLGCNGEAPIDSFHDDLEGTFYGAMYCPCVEP